MSLATKNGRTARCCSRKVQFMLRVLRIDYKSLLNDYLDVSGINGVKHINEENRSKTEKYGWLATMILVLALTFWFLLFTYISYLDAPTATTQLPQRTSVSTVPFPAVGVCDGNRLSKQLLTKFASKLFRMQNKTLSKIGDTEQEVYNSLLFLGTFYNLDSDDFRFYELDRLHSFLTEIYNGTYSIGTITRELLQPCTAHLSNCSWQTQSIDCKKIFFQRKTYLGYCCLFNYQRPTVKQFQELVLKYGKMPEATPMFLHSPGYEMGLTVIINHNMSDNAFFINSNLGTHVFIFNPLDFADSNSDAVSSYIINVGQEMFISLHPQPVSGAQEMRNVPPNARGCMFYDEKVIDYNNYYSFSECNLVCNIENLISACGCYPYFINSFYNVSECQLSDVPCLQKYVNLRNEIETSGEKISSRPFICPGCLPTCNYIRYKVQKSWGNIKPFNNRTNIKNKSVLRVFYGDSYVIEYQQTVVYTWYDLLSMFGGIFSVMIGASLLSAAEILYFMTGRFFTSFIKKYRKERAGSSKNGKPPNEILLYFNDFKLFGNTKFNK